MSRWLLLVCTLAIAPALLAADRLPEGTFEGSGSWRGHDGSSGEYSSRITITQDRFVSEFEYDHAGRRKHGERLLGQHGGAEGDTCGGGPDQGAT